MPHNTMNVELLEKIAEVIVEKCGQFDMDTWHGEGCGTAHCIGGWAEVLTGSEPGYSLIAKAQLLGIGYGLNDSQAGRLFYLDCWPEGFRNAYRDEERDPLAKAKIAADRIRHFIATDGCE